MSDPILPLAVWEEGTLQNDVPANDNSLRLEALSREVLGTEDSPTSSNDGDVFIVGGAPSGDFGTFDPDDLTIYRGGNWYAWAPVDGVVVNVAGSLFAYGGSSGWTGIGGGGGGAVDSVNGQTGVVVLSLDDLDDVDAPSPNDGDALVWVSADSAWKPVAGGGGGMSNPMTTAGDIIIGGTSGAPQRLAAGTDTYVLTMVSGSPAWAAAGGGGGGLTNWDEGVNTSAPNNGATSAVYFQAVAAATNADAVLIAKGSGATQAQIADNTTTGGNKRGQQATDWQKVRSSASQVASGDWSTIGGGRRNTTSSQESTVAGGFSNTASNSYAFIGGGSSNIASGGSSAISGGSSNTASGSNSSVPGGSQNLADGEYSVAMGLKGVARGIQGAIARSCGGFNNFNGDGQSRMFYLCQQTTDATPGVATTNRSAAGTTNQVVLPNNSSFVVRATVNVRENATGDAASWDVVAHIRRGANAASTTMVAAATITPIAADAGAAAWALDAVADTTNGALQFQVTGEASHNLKWGVDVYSCNEVVS